MFVFVYNFPHINMHMGLCLLHASTEHPFGFPPSGFPTRCLCAFMGMCVYEQLCVLYVCVLDSFFAGCIMFLLHFCVQVFSDGTLTAHMPIRLFN